MIPRNIRFGYSKFRNNCTSSNLLSRAHLNCHEGLEEKQDHQQSHGCFGKLDPGYGQGLWIDMGMGIFSSRRWPRLPLLCILNIRQLEFHRITLLTRFVVLVVVFFKQYLFCCLCGGFWSFFFFAAECAGKSHEYSSLISTCSRLYTPRKLLASSFLQLAHFSKYSCVSFIRSSCFC